MYDEWFERLREDVLRWERERNERFLNLWCKEAGVKTPVGYYMNSLERKYVVYTDRPGLLIGLHGALVEKYTKILQEEFSQFDRIEFVEIRGGFANYKAN